MESWSRFVAVASPHLELQLEQILCNLPHNWSNREPSVAAEVAPLDVAFRGAQSRIESYLTHSAFSRTRNQRSR